PLHPDRDLYRPSGRAAAGVPAGPRRGRGLGGDRADLPLVRHLATGDQYRDHDRHLLDGVPDPELAKPRRRRNAGQARRADPRPARRARAVYWHRAPARSRDRGNPRLARGGSRRRERQGGHRRRQHRTASRPDLAPELATHLAEPAALVAAIGQPPRTARKPAEHPEPGGAGMVRVVRQLLAELVVVEHFPRTREPQRGGPDEKTRRKRAQRQDDDPTGRHGAALTDCANEAKQRSTVSRKATAWENPGPARRAISAAGRLCSGLQHDP